MAAKNSTLTQSRLKDLLHYDPVTGKFTWIVTHKNGRTAKAGYVAQDGYVRIGLDRIYYKGHDLAWLYVHGEFPHPKLDHRNRNGADNRLDNLRPATQSQNTANKLSRRCTSRTRGVWPNPQGNWGAAVWKDGKRIYLGRFATSELAAIAYDEIAYKLYGEFAILNYPEHLLTPAIPQAA